VRDIKPNNEQIYCSTTEIFVSITTSQPKTNTCIVKIELLTSNVSEWHVSAIAPCANCINICHRSGFFVKSIKVVDFFVVDIFVTQPVLVLVFFRSAKIARFSSYSSRGAAKMSDPGQMWKYRNRVTIST